ncbi:hypothetical protein ACKKBF_B08640 [Auxenochlorella protothecoides x Auxenochlorella symbiontica]
MPAAADLFPIPDKATTGRGVVPLKPVSGPAVWYADELIHRPEEWRFQLSEEHIAELEAAVDAAIESGQILEGLSLDNVSLPTLGPILTGFRVEAVHGRGFQLISGLPVGRWSREQTVAAYWIIGLHWGKAVSNNHKGHLVGHIKDIGHDPASPSTRLYATSVAQPFHNDAADLVALLCLNEARQGGESQWASSWAVHNEFLKLRPDLGPVMTENWYFDRKGEVPAGKQPFFAIPAFNYFLGNLTVNWSSNYYLLSQRHEAVPRLTPAHLEAIKLFDELAASPRHSIRYQLQPGDIQLLSNHTVLHARSAFVDDAEDPNLRRHLLRLWLAPPDEFPLPEAYADILGGSVEVGKRGGIVVSGTRLNIPLEAE